MVWRERTVPRWPWFWHRRWIIRWWSFRASSALSVIIDSWQLINHTVGSFEYNSLPDDHRDGWNLPRDNKRPVTSNKLEKTLLDPDDSGNPIDRLDLKIRNHPLIRRLRNSSVWNKYKSNNFQGLIKPFPTKTSVDSRRKALCHLTHLILIERHEITWNAIRLLSETIWIFLKSNNQFVNRKDK